MERDALILLITKNRPKICLPDIFPFFVRYTSNLQFSNHEENRFLLIIIVDSLTAEKIFDFFSLVACIAKNQRLCPFFQKKSGRCYSQQVESNGFILPEATGASTYLRGEGLQHPARSRGGTS